MEEIFQRAVKASKELNLIDKSKIATVLQKIADETRKRCNEILAANMLDLARMQESNPMYDRLMLTQERIAAIASDMCNVALLGCPVGEVLSETIRPNGIKITKVRVPFGVVGVIYEARPNVSFDVFSLCFKSMNAVLLKGSTDAYESNKAIVALIRRVLEQEELSPDIAILLPPDRSATDKLLAAVSYVDVVIPRGSKSLIDYVRNNARVPIIETGAGICHTYFDIMGDIVKGADIIFNAKTRRVSVCNALDCLIVHSSRLPDLPILVEKLASKNVTIYADARAYETLTGLYPDELLREAVDSSYGTEFLDYKMAIKTVDSLLDAVEHVGLYSSKHSEAIVTEDVNAASLYSQMVDAACIYTNVSTAFTDGAQFGFGAEIGISTQKLHARGPMALAELTSYKYIISGNGQTRG